MNNGTVLMFILNKISHIEDRVLITPENLTFKTKEMIILSGTELLDPIQIMINISDIIEMMITIMIREATVRIDSKIIANQAILETVIDLLRQYRRDQFLISSLNTYVRNLEEDTPTSTNPIQEEIDKITIQMNKSITADNMREIKNQR